MSGSVKSAGGRAFLFVLANDCPRGPLLMFWSVVALPAPVRNRPAAQHRTGLSLAYPLAQVAGTGPLLDVSNNETLFRA